MQVGDIMLYTLEGDTVDPPDTFAAQIVSIDPGSLFLTCSRLDTGAQLTVQFSVNTSGPWAGQDDQGADISLATHDVYTGGGTDPVAQGAVLVTFADNRRFLGQVLNTDPTLDLAFYQPPGPKLSLDEGNVITQSDWDAYPVGEPVLSVEGAVVNNDLVQPGSTDLGAFIENSWWSLATRRPAVPGRIGGAITPYAVVVHTTDLPMLTSRGASLFNSLVTNWTTEVANGVCAHFVIGRDAASGVIQFAPITRNANHAEGPGHGWFVTGAQRDHPNSVSVGIEVHCAGILRKLNGQWWYAEWDKPSQSWVAQGKAIPDEEVVFPDTDHPDQGYHSVTDYQYQQLGLLLDGLETVLAALPEGCVAESAEAPPAWGVFPTGRRVGHVSLHAAERGDPWPATCAWMRARA